TGARATRWALPAVAGGCLIVVGAAFAAGVALRSHPGRHSDAVASIPKGPIHVPLYPAGRLAAPDFSLRDQDGRRFSLSQYRGRPVLITFVDPLCRNLCPLEAHALNAAVDELPPAQRPEIVAVSVDVYADTRHDLMQDFTRWELVPQWRWGVGGDAQLASIWKRYRVFVQVVNKTLAGVTVHYITHTEAAYLIDPSGHERALFEWPFLPGQVVAAVRELAHPQA
ncbi:MAG: SCO family protein, partial [Solirubrobacteraceae bacterium]